MPLRLPDVQAAQERNRSSSLNLIGAIGAASARAFAQDLAAKTASYQAISDAQALQLKATQAGYEFREKQRQFDLAQAAARARTQESNDFRRFDDKNQLFKTQNTALNARRSRLVAERDQAISNAATVEERDKLEQFYSPLIREVDEGLLNLSDEFNSSFQSDTYDPNGPSDGLLGGEGFVTAQATRYGYSDDPYLDPNSAKAIGNRGNQLADGSSVALKRSTAEKLGLLQNGKPGGTVIAEFPDGTTRELQVDDTIPESSGDNDRIDFYDPSGKAKDFDGVPIKLRRPSKPKANPEANLENLFLDLGRASNDVMLAHQRKKINSHPRMQKARADLIALDRSTADLASNLRKVSSLEDLELIEDQIADAAKEEERKKRKEEEVKRLGGGADTPTITEERYYREALKSLQDEGLEVEDKRRAEATIETFERQFPEQSKIINPPRGSFNDFSSFGAAPPRERQSVDAFFDQ
jgi:hypothetical protein